MIVSMYIIWHWTYTVASENAPAMHCA
jgi:hypothetical protein